MAEEPGTSFSPIAGFFWVIRVRSDADLHAFSSKTLVLK